MFFLRIASFFLAALTFGPFSVAKPVPVIDERALNPFTLATNLQTKVDSLTAQLQGITSNTPLNLISAQALVSQIIGAVVAAAAQVPTGSLLKRQTDTAVADVLGSTISTIGSTFVPLVGTIPVLGPSVVGIDGPLDSLVIGLNSVVPGLTGTLGSLLSGDAGNLNALGLSSLLGTLGL